MQKRILIIYCLLYSLLHIQAQNYTVSGYVTEKGGSETLYGANVFNSSTAHGTATDSTGFYSLSLPKGRTTLSYSYVGYKAKQITFNLTKDTLVNMTLGTTRELQEVEVTAAQRIQENSQMSNITLPLTQIKSLPALLGETDLLKALQLLPGVQSGGEGSTGLYVRGGGADQNLIILDDVPLYNVSHLFGFFSVFNANAIDNVELYKGGFPARYGGRLSSVVDVSMKEGDMKKWHGEGSIGLISANATLEGPIIKDKASFIISARRTYIDLFATPIIKAMQSDDENTSLDYFFYDLNAKLTYRLTQKDRINLSLYMGDDKFKIGDKDTPSDTYSWGEVSNNIEWGNRTGALRWTHIWNDIFFSNVTATYSDYRFNVGMNSWNYRHDYSKADNTITEYYGAKYNSSIEDWAGRITFDYFPSLKHYIRFGGAVTLHTFSPGATQFRSTEDENKDYGSEEVRGQEFNIFAEDDMTLNSRLKANIGVHWSGFAVHDRFYHQIQPRISARYLFTDNLSAKLSYSRMAQYIHLLTNSSIGLPTDMWVPSTKDVKPQTGNQYAIGVAQTFRQAYEVSLEAYYKTMNNVIEYKEGSSFLNTNSNWEEKVFQGEGRSYGMELFVQKKTGNWTGWIGYTLSWSNRKFAQINNGKPFPYKYDRRHDISVAAIKKIRKNIELSAVWVFGTGNAITIPIGIYQADNPTGPVNFKYPSANSSQYIQYGERNAYRMAAYHRLDLSAAFIKKTRWGERRWVFGLYNAYSHRNPFYIDIVASEMYQQDMVYAKYTYKQFSLFPIIPSISYQFKF